MKNYITLIGLIGIVILTSGWSWADRATRKVQSKPAKYILSADQLYSAYDSNEVAASERYKGKIVIVSGIIQDIGLTIMNYPYIIIGGTGCLDGVHCVFTKSEKSSITYLSKGDHVRVKGKVSGKMINVLVKKCRITKVRYGPDYK